MVQGWANSMAAESESLMAAAWAHQSALVLAPTRAQATATMLDSLLEALSEPKLEPASVVSCIRPRSSSSLMNSL